MWLLLLDFKTLSQSLMRFYSRLETFRVLLTGLIFFLLCLRNKAYKGKSTSYIQYASLNMIDVFQLLLGILIKNKLLESIFLKIIMHLQWFSAH